MPTLPAVRHLVDVTPDLLHANEEVTVPGALPVQLDCEFCASSRHWHLPRGRWAIDHTHDGQWTAHLLALPPREPAARAALAVPADVAALAAGLAEAATR